MTKGTRLDGFNNHPPRQGHKRKFKMISTKLTKKVLSKKEQRHLSEMGIKSMADFKRTRTEQKRMLLSGTGFEPCWDCKMIAAKLGIES